MPVPAPQNSRRSRLPLRRHQNRLASQRRIPDVATAALGRSVTRRISRSPRLGAGSAPPPAHDCPLEARPARVPDPHRVTLAPIRLDMQSRPFRLEPPDDMSGCVVVRSDVIPHRYHGDDLERDGIRQIEQRLLDTPLRRGQHGHKKPRSFASQMGITATTFLPS